MRRERARGEKTHTFRINIVPRSRKEKGRSTARSTARIAPGFGEELPLPSVVAVMDFTAPPPPEDGTLAPLERSSTVVPLFLAYYSGPPSCHALSRKRRHFGTTRAQRSAIILIRRSEFCNL